jgi:hypothetical protein
MNPGSLRSPWRPDKGLLSGRHDERCELRFILRPYVQRG